METNLSIDFFGAVCSFSSLSRLSLLIPDFGVIETTLVETVFWVEAILGRFVVFELYKNLVARNSKY